jgi:antitoxin ParD1/3/4
MTFDLTPEFERAVLERVRSGRYKSTDEVLRACIEALEREERSLEELRRDVKVGLDELERGEGIPGKEAFEQIREDVRKRTGR